MTNLLQSFARANLNRGARLAIAASLLAAFALPVTADGAETAVPFHGQEAAIFVEGNPIIHCVESQAEISLKKSNEERRLNTYQDARSFSRRLLDVWI